MEVESLTNGRMNSRRVMKVPKKERLVLFDFDDEEDDSTVSEETLSEEKSPVFYKNKKTWLSAKVDEDMGNEIHSMLNKFGDDISNSLRKKRQRVEMCFKTIYNENSYKMKEAWKTKQKQMLQVNNKYYRQFMNLFHQWELEKKRYEKQQENLITMFKQQQMILRQCKIKQKQRLRLIVQMVIKYTELLQNMEDNNDNLLNVSLTELKKEIAVYQKKYMMETQRQEIANIRKSLQSILF